MAARWIHGHGSDRRGAHVVWRRMLNRCSNPKCKDWKNYGGRGIKVCERWKSFDLFLADMGEPALGMSIERVKNNGPYSPKNCEWIPMAQQRLNTRRIHLISYKGVTKPLKHWAITVGITVSSMRKRIIKHGVKKAIAAPVLEWRKQAGSASVRAQGKNAFIKRAKARWRTRPRKLISSLGNKK